MIFFKRANFLVCDIYLFPVFKKAIVCVRAVSGPSSPEQMSAVGITGWRLVLGTGMVQNRRRCQFDRVVKSWAVVQMLPRSGHELLFLSELFQSQMTETQPQKEH